MSVQELKDYMSGFTLNPVYGQDDAAVLVLQGIQADLERYLNRYLEPRTVTETVPVNSDGSIRTNHDPIISVPAGSAYVLQNGRLYTYTLGTTFTLGQFGSPEEYATVTYTAGIDARSTTDVVGVYADVRLAILRVAAREMTNRHDDTLSVKGLETENVGEPTGPQNGVQGWTMDELRMHDRLRKRVIA